MKNRRFYFDNGVKRTFWYIRTQGRDRITSTGRLGSTGRTSSKVFDRPADANRDANRQIEKKVAAGFIEYCSTDGLAYRRKNRQPPRKQFLAKIRELERDFSLQIPTQFRRYLDRVNGGCPVEDFISLPAHPHIDVIDVGSILGICNDSAFSVRGVLEWTSPALPTGHLPISWCRDQFSIALSRKQASVYFWESELIEVEDVDEQGNCSFKKSHAHLAAHCFDEFLTRIAKYPNDTSCT